MIDRLFYGFSLFSSYLYPAFGQLLTPYYYEDTQKTKTNKEVFKELNFPARLIPQDFCERVNGQYEILNAIENNPALEAEIKQFVEKQKLLGEALRASVIGFKMQEEAYSNQAKLNTVQLAKDLIAELHIDPITKCIMTYPVTLNAGREDQCIVDLRSLLNFWQDNKSHYTHPITHELLISIKPNSALQEVIAEWVDFEIKKVNGFDISEEAMQSQMIAIQDKIKQFGQPETAFEILSKNRGRLPEVPQKFIAENLDGNIITHPVSVDGKSVVCFLKLQEHWATLQRDRPAYWKKYPYENPFELGRSVRSLIYQTALKKEIDEYVKNPKVFLLNHASLTSAPSSTLHTVLPSISSESLMRPSNDGIPPLDLTKLSL